MSDYNRTILTPFPTVRVCNATHSKSLTSISYYNYTSMYVHEKRGPIVGFSFQKYTNYYQEKNCDGYFFIFSARIRPI